MIINHLSSESYVRCSLFRFCFIVTVGVVAFWLLAIKLLLYVYYVQTYSVSINKSLKPSRRVVCVCVCVSVCVLVCAFSVYCFCVLACVCVSVCMLLCVYVSVMRVMLGLR